jgi:hypothetical protein
VQQPGQDFTAKELVSHGAAEGLSDTSAIAELGRRVESRYAVDEESVLSIVGQGLPVPSRIIELSQEGCRVQTAKPVSVRSRLPVEILFKVSGTAFRFRGIVQWVSGSNLLGIQFVNMIPRHMVALADVLCEMEAARAVRAEAAKKLAAAHEACVMAGPVPERSPQPAVSVAPAMENAAQETSPAPKRRDRRQSTRHELNDSAEIRLVNVGSMLKGRILDLSLGGCCIRTAERFPVGIYTRVETEFYLQGLPFRLGGVIQAIHDRDTVGIRFLDLSDRKRQQVLELIDEISEMRTAHVPSALTPAEGRV